MTNSELQELLATYPPDALVTLRFYSYEGEIFFKDINETHISLDAEGDIILDAVDAL